MIKKIAKKIINRLFPKPLPFTQTYAQGGEDILIAMGLKMANITHPTYLDIGTNHPISLNNTYLLYEKGASGVCVEPNPVFNNLIKKHRPKDMILNLGVGKVSGETLDFYVLIPDVLSTFDAKEVEELSQQGHITVKEIIKVPTLSINDIIEKHCVQLPDIVSIDVEGWNQDIVESFDFTRCRPSVFCIETITFTMDSTGAKIMPIINRMIENGYWILGETHINTIFIDGRVVKQRILE